MRREDYAALGGHLDAVRPVEEVLRDVSLRQRRVAGAKT